MAKKMWRKFREILEDVHNKYGLKAKEDIVEPAEVLYAACIFFSRPEEKKEKLLNNDKEQEKYYLLKLSVKERVKQFSGESEYDFEEMRKFFACDFPYINRISHYFRTKKESEMAYSMEDYDEIVADDTVPEHNNILLFVEYAARMFYSNKDIFSVLKYYREYIHTLEQKGEVKKGGEDIENVVLLRKGLRERLKEKIKGQDMAVDKFVDGFTSHLIRGKVAGKPAAVYLFAGAPGNGKTYLAESFAEIMKTANYAYKRFDMAAYGGGGSDGGLSGLVGFEKSWRDAQPGQLTDFVRKNPKCILLFDEIEKANAQVRMLFLSVLEGATLTDKYYDRKVSFEDAILIFTTNEGRDLYEKNRDTNLTAMPDSVVMDGLKASKFPPELISRFMSGTVIMFNHLNYNNKLEIFRASVAEELERIKNTGMDFEITQDEALEKLYFMNKGANIDARFVSANAKKMVEEYFLKAMDYVKSEYGGDLKEIKEICVEVEKSEAARELFTNTKKPRILICSNNADEVYLGNTDELGEYNPTEMKVEKLSNVAEYTLVKPEDLENYLRNCNWSFKENSEHFDAIVIDLFADRGKQTASYTKSKEFWCIGIAEKEAPEVPLVLVNKENVFWRYDMDEDEWEKWHEEDMTFSKEEEGAFNLRGVKDFIKGAYHTLDDVYSDDADVAYHEGWEKWDLVLDKKELGRLLERYYFMEVLSSLAKKREKISADVIFDYKQAVGTLNIVFTNLQRKEVIAEQTESRKRKEENRLKKCPQVRMKDVFGNELTIKTVKRCIDYIRYPEKYQRAGAKTMNGILLYGASGMGKSIIARAMACESGASFLSAVGTDFFREDGIFKLKELFQVARCKKPCIIFIDEMEAILEGGNRRASAYGKSLTETLLKEMEDEETDNERIYVVGAVCGSLENLSNTVLRRFGAKVEIPYPNLKEREAFFAHVMKEKGLEDAISERAIKTLNLLMYEKVRSFAEIELFMEESIAEAVYENVPVTEKFLYKRIQDEKDGVTLPEENRELRKSAAYHEAGHAVLQWIFGKRNDYVTIVSRGNYGGYSIAKLDLYTGQDFLNHICIAYAGRVAEMLYRNPDAEEENNNLANVGAVGDLQKATQIAYDYVCRYGFSENSIVLPPKYAMQPGNYPESILPEKEQEEIWKMIRTILKEQRKRTVELLKAHWEEVDALARSLEIRKELDGETVEKIIQSKAVVRENNEHEKRRVYYGDNKEREGGTVG